MTRRRRVILVCVLGLVAGTIAHVADSGGKSDVLTVLAAGLVLGELLHEN